MALEPAALTRLARLVREVDLDLAALDARAAETAQLLGRWRSTGELPRPELVLVAVNLHGYYTALEVLLERVARLLDDEVPSGPAWHVDLVEQMQTAVPSLRPAVLEPASVADLHELRKFRHFFRNAYVLELDAARVRQHAERLERIHPSVRRGIVGLRGHVDDLIGQLGGA